MGRARGHRARQVAAHATAHPSALVFHGHESTRGGGCFGTVEDASGTRWRYLVTDDGVVWNGELSGTGPEPSPETFEQVVLKAFGPRRGAQKLREFQARA